MSLGGFGIGQDRAQGLIDFVGDRCGQFARRRKAIDMGQFDHPLPEVHFCQMTPPPLEQKQHDEAALKRNRRADRRNLPTISISQAVRGLKIDAAPRRKVALANPPTLHLPPVEFRRGVFHGWSFDVTCFFTVEDAGRDGRRYRLPSSMENIGPPTIAPSK